MKLAPAVLAALTALLLSAGSVMGAGASFKLMAPADEAFVSSSSVLIIAKVEGNTSASRAEIMDNRKTLGFAPLKENTLVYIANLSPGRHEIVLAAPGVRRRSIRVFVGQQDDYSYHVENSLEYCGSCHKSASRGGYERIIFQRELCAECHDPVDAGKIVHGPVAAGACTPCHDPHGSRNRLFLVAVGRDLCLNCHSQNLSKNHIEKRRNDSCIKCHNPHSSEKNYLLR